MKSNLTLQNLAVFSLVNARALALASQQAYLPIASLAGLTSPGGNVSLITGIEEESQVVITRYDDCTVVAFRGTVSLRNWITDAEFILQHTPDGRVHDGFLRAVDCIMPLLIKLLLPDGADRAALKPLVFTGHSLGGAMAVLTAFLLAKQGLPVAQVYTFGQPRVGDARFAAAYSALLGGRTFRLVNQNDIVPRLPGWLLKYRHAGQLAFINPGGTLVLNPSLLGLLISDALGLYQAYRKLDDVLVTEHFMSAYQHSLDNLEIN